MMPALVVILDVLVAATLVVKRARALFPLAAAGLVVVLLTHSAPRLVGDSGEYIAMAVNLAQFHRPSLSAAELADVVAYVPDEAGRRLVQPEFLGADGRQDFEHFWFYSLLAAPFVRAAIAFYKSPIDGFMLLNAMLLFAACLVLARRSGPAAAALVILGPVLWWVDKAHTEVFTVSLLALGVSYLESAPWWSAVAFGAASTQNPPIAAAAVLVIAFMLATKGWRDWRVLAGSAAAIAMAALHPLYFHARLGIWSGLSSGLDKHWPSSAELLAPLADLNVGILVHDPFIAVAALGGLLLMLSRGARRIILTQQVLMVLIGIVFLFSFTQTGNFNSGGTPGPSRYGLWLLPLAIPAIAPAGASRWMQALAAASVFWCSSHFAMALPEGHLRPTELAASVWQHEPQIDNPLAEIFTERVSGSEPGPKPPIATDDCSKLLVVGDGINVGWPERCADIVPNAPSECRETGALCYANRLMATYVFKRAPATPAWIAWEQRPEAAVYNQTSAAQSNLSLPPVERPKPTLWLGDGWSYQEHALGAPADIATWRWMGERAVLDIVFPTSAQARLRLVLRSFRKPRRMRISLKGTAVTTLSIGEAERGYETPVIDFVAGTNSLVFEALDGTDTPGGADTRRLSVALFHADIVN